MCNDIVFDISKPYQDGQTIINFHAIEKDSNHPYFSCQRYIQGKLVTFKDYPEVKIKKMVME